MKYFKLNNDVYAFEFDGSQDNLITDDFIEMTDDEIDQHINPQKHLSDEEKLAYKRSQYPSLTRYQFLRCLLENGYKSEAIETQILTIEDEFTRELTLLGFKEATNFVRTDDSIIAMQSVLNFSDDRVDTMWEQALMF